MVGDTANDRWPETVGFSYLDERAAGAGPASGVLADSIGAGAMDVSASPHGASAAHGPSEEDGFVSRLAYRGAVIRISR